MGKAFFLIAYGMAWGYVIHAKEIDKKLIAFGRELWEDGIRSRVAIEMHEYDRQMAFRAALGLPEDEHTEKIPGAMRAAG